MNVNNKTYPTQERFSELGVKYIFLSNGPKKIVKLIDYSLVDVIEDELIFNLAFGDFDVENNVIIDNVNTNNGDAYTVFNTVLSTVPKFFDIYGNVTLSVQGSDSFSGFKDICRQSCKKKCNDSCKNADRRISIYRHYVNKNFKPLNEDYAFAGGTFSANNQTVKEIYEPGKSYDVVFIRKKS